MKYRFTGIVLAGTAALLVLTACAGPRSYHREPLYEAELEPGTVINSLEIPAGLESRILALDPEKISRSDVTDVLAKAPAPRIVNIHGGVFPAHMLMNSFSKFLMGMGYPEGRIRNVADGTFSYTSYLPQEHLVGVIAWHYEHEGMRPMIIGHSHGGFEAVKALHTLAGEFREEVRPWNPLTKRYENRTDILDPVTGERIPIVGGLRLSYVTATGSGGITRALPQQWTMLGRLRQIPDTVDAFTGYYMPLDFLGGDLMGFGQINDYEAMGTAKVRNVRLPLGYRHISVLATGHLMEDPEIIEWIDNYQPSETPTHAHKKFEGSGHGIIWAADVWHGIKKHWCLELQRVVKARRGSPIK